MIISPSAIALQALGLQPSGNFKATAAGPAMRCSMCGVGIEPGSLYDKLDLPESFTNKLAMAIPGGEHICGACKTVMGEGAFQQSLATAIVSTKGYFPIMKKENRAWAFLDPPESPFFVTIQNAQQQHVVWRAPVSLSREIILVRVGEQVLRLRRQKLKAAREIVLRLDDFRHRISVHDGKARKPKKAAAAQDAAESPFVADWKYQSADGGVMKQWYRDLVAAGNVPEEEQAVLSSLNAGEVWALQAVLHRTPVEPESKSV
ncbi:MAG: hypothetical protein KJZ92_16515 [Rhodocyclaceae bacterium]|nr:hypothetical protein [Opitutaceae bacterium]MCL4682855.1 hypothetical protein [Rhodocyclaceae bacterium]